MHWGLFSSVFIFATVKFMFAPFSGSAMGLPYWETYIASVTGGSLSATIFYFFSEVIIKYTHNRKIRKNEQLLKEGKPVKKKKIFTKTNRTIIRVKQSIYRFFIIQLSIPDTASAAVRGTPGKASFWPIM